MTRFINEINKTINHNIQRGSHISLGIPRIGIQSVGFCGGRKTIEPERKKKNPRSKSRTNHKLNPLMAPRRSRTQARLVGGQRSQHCAIPAPLIKAENTLLVIQILSDIPKTLYTPVACKYCSIRKSNLVDAWSNFLGSLPPH